MMTGETSSLAFNSRSHGDGNALQNVSLRDVTVGGEMGRRIDVTIRNSFLKLDLDNDFLRLFRNRRPEAELGWNDRFIGLGMLLDSAVLLSAYANNQEATARKDYLVAETIKTQSANGYIGVFEEAPKAAHLWTDWCWSDLAYIVIGLASEFHHFGNRAALEAACKLGDYLIERWPLKSEDAVFTTLGTAEGFAMLYDATGNGRYLNFAADVKMGRNDRIVPNAVRTWQQEVHLDRYASPEEADLVVHTNEDHREVVRCHVYRLLSRCVMQLWLNRTAPSDNLLVMSRRVFDGITRRDKTGMVITGTASMAEGWHENQDGRGRLGENCATVYLLRFLDELIRLDADLSCGDIQERAIYNSFFASQSPDGRRLRYFTPFSGPRAYYDHDSFCCPCNFRRGMGRLPALVYYHCDGGLAINHYTASTARVELGDDLALELHQETDYPTSGTVKITLAPSRPAAFPLRLRIPRWAAEYTVAVNDEKIAPAAAPGGIVIAREWRAGDVVTLHLPMPWRWVKGRELQAGRAALMRGPVVYCLSRERNQGLAEMELRDITLDPSSVGDPLPCDFVRPDGRKCRIGGRRPGGDPTAPADLDLVLTEFVDPTGEEIYFCVSDDGITVADELINSE